MQATSSTAKNDWNQTWWYVGGAALCLAITGAAEFAGRPASIQEFGKVGQPFYADFVDPTLASSMEVYVFDAKSVRPVDFRVQRLPNGRWVIPSHHNYPADAEERLGQTAASTIGITRGALVTRWPADHARYGVVNPKQDSLTVDQVEGIGQRITFRKDNDSVLADFIVGKKVDGATDQYYVRHPEEDEVYIATLNIDLSTKFTDWIDTDLFEFSNGEILQLTINDYSFNELNGQLTKRDVTSLSRDKSWSNDWVMDGLDTEVDELNTQSIGETLNAIADLKVVGVRPKQQGLTPDLQLDRESIRSQQGVDQLQQDLLARGFLLQPGERGGDSLNLVSREGELYAGTDDGLRYRMYFGRVFTGSQEELEVGFATDAKSEDAAAAESNNDENAPSDAPDTADPANENTSKPGRYLFVRVEFDVSLLGTELTEPVEPEKPAALVAAEQDAAANKDEANKDEANKDEGNESTQDADKPEAAADGDQEAEDESETESELDRLKREFSEAQEQYRNAKREYEQQQEKIKEGKDKADGLNRRFAEWYYVIPGESFDKLKLDRGSLVQPKTAEGETAGENTDAGAIPRTLLAPPPQEEDDSEPQEEDDSDATASEGEESESPSGESLDDDTLGEGVEEGSANELEAADVDGDAESVSDSTGAEN